jgi:hypothetical protein
MIHRRGDVVMVDHPFSDARGSNVRPMTVGEPLPSVPLALNGERSLLIDLEHTYREAARRAYLE